jgi:hypothetical protein
MLLPAAVKDGPLQVFLEESGIWRDMTVPPAVPETQEDLQSDLEQHLSGLMQRVAATPPADMRPDKPGFKAKFIVRYNSLLPKEVGDTLRQTADEAAAAPGAERPLLEIFLKPGLEWIPWELLHDGTGFLGLRFAISRLPVLSSPLSLGGPRQRRVDSVFNLLAKNVLEDAPLQDWMATFDGFGKNGDWQRRFPSAAAPDVYPSVVDLESAQGVADIVHVTCHGGLKDGKAYYWTLDHKNAAIFDYKISSDVAQSTKMAKRPLVFGNACASVATSAENLGAMHSFGSNFLIGGALNFVGTFAPITKTMAVAFARRFYQKLLGTGGAKGLPIAQALLQTKLSFSAEGAQDPSYLFYCLYGPADATYTLD